MEEVDKKWYQKILPAIWNGLAEKGKFTTVLGLAIVIAAVTDPLIKHNQGITFNNDYMFQIIYFVLGGIILIILPSEISISKTDGFKIKD